ncbi:MULTISPECIES: phage holin family protein [unclassified Maridesulfovibrio]|uniref:phage holin family protein n=1 Tax=unclassified Maridesulfovibrio TaxID=2794999 RepID=UPI003B42AC3E
MMNQLFSDAAIKTVCSACCTGISWLVGGYDMALLAILVLMIADLVLGIMLALRDGTYNNPRVVRGFLKFILYGVVIVVSNMVDITIEQGSFPAVLAKFREFVVFWFAVTEFISITKHLTRMGVRIIPQKLIERLQYYQDNYDPISGRMDYGAGGYGYGAGQYGQHRPYTRPASQRAPSNPGHTGMSDEDMYG